MLEAYAVVVGDERMTKRATVERYRKVRTAVNGLLIAFAKSEEKFVLIRKTVIDAHRPGCVQNRIDRTKKEIVSQLILVSRRSEEHTSELQSLAYLVCRLLLEKKKKKKTNSNYNSK